MRFAVSYVLVLIWFAYLIICGVILFSRGFLLSRVSKTTYNTCKRLSTDPNDENYMSKEMLEKIYKDVNISTDLCLPQKSKVIILLIDALKYDFGVYQPNQLKPLPYENKLTVLYELLEKKPEQTRLMHFKADPPTTTMQRLKGITTGTLPTFVDVGSNFATPEINEDNIIDQMVRYRLPIIFLGDSTWTDLYPRRFLRSYSYPSFDIFDLDTIDKNIEKRLPYEMAKNDWQILIAHFLGVDHCGHRYGPMHNEMSRKLIQMNNMIRRVIKQMDNETVLFVIGDHGMTATGDHGGDTNDEIDALLFAYTKHNKFLKIMKTFSMENNTLQQIDLVPTLSTILGIPIPYSNLGLINLNLVPDISLPNMNQLQILLIHIWQNTKQIYNYFQDYVLDNKRIFNMEQYEHLQMEYKLFSQRIKTIYNNNHHKHHNDDYNNHDYNRSHDNDDDSNATFNSFYNDLNRELRLILNICQELWIKFDNVQMSHGLLITITTIFFIFILMNNNRSMDFYKIFTIKGIIYTYLINIMVGIFASSNYFKNFIISTTISSTSSSSSTFKTDEHAILFLTSLISLLILIYKIIKNSSIIINNSLKLLRKNYYYKNQKNQLIRIILFIMFIINFSNSFIINEGKILSYLLISNLLLILYELIQKAIIIIYDNNKMKMKFKSSSSSSLSLLSLSIYNRYRSIPIIIKLCIIGLFIITSLIRFTTITLFRCREEQENCLNFHLNNQTNKIINNEINSSMNSISSIKSINSINSNKIGNGNKNSWHDSRCILPVLSVILYSVLNRLYLRSCGNLTGYAINVLLARYGPTICTICVAAHMLLDNSFINNIPRIHIDSLALIVYCFLLLQLIIIFYNPIMVHILPMTNHSNGIIINRNTNNIIHEIFHKMKFMYEKYNSNYYNANNNGNGKSNTNHTNVPIVYGLATVYSSILISMGIFMAMVLLILLEAKSSMGFIICIAVAALLLIIHSQLSFRMATDFESCLEPKFMIIIGWFLLGHFCFFATSHQTTLSQIDWRSAFVGRSIGIGQSKFISGFLVISSTFCGQLFFFSLYGLLTTEMFSIFALFPRLIKSNSYQRKRQRQYDRERVIERGERFIHSKLNNPISIANSKWEEESLLTELSNKSVGFDMTRGELILYEREYIFLGAIFKLASQFIMLQGLKIFCTMLACTIHCRHLMVWKIFAPRFIYESFATFVSLFAIVFGFIIILRIHKAVDTFIVHINKTI